MRLLNLLRPEFHDVEFTIVLPPSSYEEVMKPAYHVTGGRLFDCFQEECEALGFRVPNQPKLILGENETIVYDAETDRLLLSLTDMQVLEPEDIRGVIAHELWHRMDFTKHNGSRYQSIIEMPMFESWLHMLTDEEKEIYGSIGTAADAFARRVIEPRADRHAVRRVGAEAYESALRKAYAFWEEQARSHGDMFNANGDAVHVSLEARIQEFKDSPNRVFIRDATLDYLRR